MNTHKDVFIVLKKSLKWVPIAGWVRNIVYVCAYLGMIIMCDRYLQGMQFFDFIFLARSWAADKLQLSRHLSRIGRMAEKTDKPLTLILYPEGTLVSKDTRPISKKFADKMGMVSLISFPGRHGPYDIIYYPIYI
jgi:1-acyl-sn-glycerol-3-phosphate acyltransferase